MEYDEIIASRLSVLESRIVALEQQLFVLTRGSTVTPKRKRKELSPEERSAIRQRLVAGKEAKRERELTEAAAKTTEAQAKANKKKEVTNEG